MKQDDIDENQMIGIGQIDEEHKAKIRKQGVHLKELADIVGQVQEPKLEHKTIFGDEFPSESEFRKSLVEALDNKGSYIMLNWFAYEMFGHVSPISAYSSESDMFLVLDVWPHGGIQPVWIATQELFTNLQSFIDSESERTRGIIIVGQQIEIGLFVGLNHGHKVNQPAKMAWKTRPALRKGALSKRSAFVRQIIQEVAGHSPLEKRMLEMIRTGVAAKEKKAVKLARAKLGTHRRAQHKKEELTQFILAQKRK